MPKAEAKPITLTIDDIEVTVPDGTTVINAARSAGVYIPYLCDHPALRPWGACRMCTVEIQNARGIPTSCTTPVGAGMVVKTNTEAVQKLRRSVMELILTEHPIGCLSCHKRDQCGPQETCLRSVAVDFRCVTCPANYRCELQLNCDYVGLDELALPYRNKAIPLRKDPLIALDWNLCIVCGRCVRVCDEIRVVGVYGMMNRSGKSTIDTAYGDSLEESGCIFCGACVDVCPVGAIEERRNRFAGVADSVAESVCNYCSDGCGFRLEQKRGTTIRISPMWDSPINGGMFCVKGRFGTSEPLHHAARLTAPLVRKNGELVPTDWDEALAIVARELGSRKGSGLGVIGSVRTTNEATYLLQKLARGPLETANIDTTASLADTAGLIGLKEILGIGASTAPSSDIAETDCLLIVGDNVTQSNPVTGMKILQAVRRQVEVAPHTEYFSYLPDVGVREHKRPALIVIDPRKIELCQYADVWLRPRPGTDAIVLGGILSYVLSEILGAEKTDGLAGIEALRESLAAFDLASVETATGVAADDIVRAAKAYAEAGTALSIFGRGLTQQSGGVDAVKALASLAAVTGNYGKTGAGILHLVGANNTRGALDLGVHPAYRPGYVEATGDGLGLTAQLAAAGDGSLKALYIVGANPAQSAADGAAVRQALQKVEFLVVQDMYLTETAKYAHVVLPAASFAEQDGTFTNHERTVQRIRQSIPPVGLSRPDWRIFCEIGQALGATGFDYVHSLEVFDEIAATSSLHRGMSYDLLDDGPISWPVKAGAAAGELSAEDFTVNLQALSASKSTAVVEGNLPLSLSLRGSFQHFGTATQTSLVKQFAHFKVAGSIELNPVDAAGIQAAEGDRVRVITSTGIAEAPLHLTDELFPGMVTVDVTSAGAGANVLFSAATDKASGTPVFKNVPARVERA